MAMEHLSEEKESNPPRSERRPRPEAVALGWRDMLENTRDATEKLIDWLISATEVSRDTKTFTSDSAGALREQFATSVLIAGDRGFGKTTVLLSAATAFQSLDTFIPEPRNGTPLDERSRKLRSKIKDAQQSIVWLDPLDMEPLPPDANLLATLLVRVQNALRPDRRAQEKDTESGASSALLVEEGLDEPWAKIEPLVRHASFMWDSSAAQASGARELAANQIKAADIYATFQKDFFEAIDSVARFKSKRSFGSGKDEQKVILVLPIDNVDRSIQHLSRIIKLIRMVASPRLWFLLAAGREEFQLFLERTFQQELNDAGALVHGARARDASMAIARRQAAGALRRVLPNIHRIEIEALSARKIWEFKAPQSVTGAREDTRCIRDFLQALKLPKSPTPTDGLKTLADLFDLRERLSSSDEGTEGPRLVDEYVQVLKEQGDYEEARPPPAPEQAETRQTLLALRARLQARGDKLLLEEDFLWALQEPPSEEPPLLSLAARFALSMSARSAVDLWQEARRAVQEQPSDREPPASPSERRGEEAIDLAYRMLRMAIDESDLPSWASEQLLHRVLRKDSSGCVFLDLTSEPVQRLKLTTLSDVLEWPLSGDKPEGPALRSELCLRHIMDVILLLKDPEGSGRTTYLPANVAGWYMILHDLLVLTVDGRMLTNRVAPFDVTPQLVVTRHEACAPRDQIVELNFRWMLPEWETFIDSYVFTMQWKTFLHRVRGLFISSAEDGRARADATHFRLIQAAWVDCVCAVAGSRRGQWDWTPLNPVIRERRGGDGEREEAAESDQTPPTRIDASALDAYEAQVASNARELFEHTYGDLIRFGRASAARHWLETFLPTLMGLEFLPRDASRRFKALVSGERGEAGDVPTLEAVWKRYEKLVVLRRRELVRAEVMKSPAYAQMQEIYKGATGRGARECGRWLEQACDVWFEALKGLDSGSSP